MLVLVIHDSDEVKDVVLSSNMEDLGEALHGYEWYREDVLERTTGDPYTDIKEIGGYVGFIHAALDLFHDGDSEVGYTLKKTDSRLILRIKEDYVKGESNFATASLALRILGCTGEEAARLLKSWDEELLQDTGTETKC